MSRNLAPLWFVGAVALILHWGVPNLGALFVAALAADDEPIAVVVSLNGQPGSPPPRTPSMSGKKTVALICEDSDSAQSDPGNAPALVRDAAVAVTYDASSPAAVSLGPALHLAPQRAFDPRAPPSLTA